MPFIKQHSGVHCQEKGHWVGEMNSKLTVPCVACSSIIFELEPDQIFNSNVIG